MAALLVAVSVWAAACARPESITTHRLSMPEQASAWPSVATDGPRIAVVWSAALDAGPAEIFAATSTDGGLTFGAPVRVDDGAAVPRTSGEQPPQAAWVGDELAVVWPARRDARSEIRYTISRDRAAAFQPSRVVHAADVPGMRGWASLAAQPDGTLHVAWLDGRHAAPAPGGHVHGAPGGPAPRQDLFYARVAPGGEIHEIRVATDVCFCCKTAVLAGESGVDLAWRHIFPGSMRDIAWTRVPRDGAPEGVVRVSEDNWQIDACPDDGPALAVDETGTRHIVWPTLVDGPGPAKGIFYARSDRGASFAARERVDDASSTTPSHPRVAMTGAGDVIAAWDERVEGVPRVRIRRRSGTGGWLAAETITTGAAGYYPALGTVPGGLIIAWVSQAEPFSTIVVQRRGLD
jgi:hypothetical protein